MVLRYNRNGRGLTSSQPTPSSLYAVLISALLILAADALYQSTDGYAPDYFTAISDYEKLYGLCNSGYFVHHPIQAWGNPVNGVSIIYNGTTSQGTILYDQLLSNMMCAYSSLHQEWTGTATWDKVHQLSTMTDDPSVYIQLGATQWKHPSGQTNGEIRGHTTVGLSALSFTHSSVHSVGVLQTWTELGMEYCRTAECDYSTPIICNNLIQSLKLRNSNDTTSNLLDNDCWWIIEEWILNKEQYNISTSCHYNSTNQTSYVGINNLWWEEGSNASTILGIYSSATPMAIDISRYGWTEDQVTVAHSQTSQAGSAASQFTVGVRNLSTNATTKLALNNHNHSILLNSEPSKILGYLPYYILENSIIGGAHTTSAKLSIIANQCHYNVNMLPVAEIVVVHHDDGNQVLTAEWYGPQCTNSKIATVLINNDTISALHKRQNGNLVCQALTTVLTEVTLYKDSRGGCGKVYTSQLTWENGAFAIARSGNNGTDNIDVPIRAIDDDYFGSKTTELKGLAIGMDRSCVGHANVGLPSAQSPWTLTKREPYVLARETTADLKDYYLNSQMVDSLSAFMRDQASVQHKGAVLEQLTVAATSNFKGTSYGENALATATAVGATFGTIRLLRGYQTIGVHSWHVVTQVMLLATGGILVGAGPAIVILINNLVAKYNNVFTIYATGNSGHIPIYNQNGFYYYYAQQAQLTYTPQNELFSIVLSSTIATLCIITVGSASAIKVRNQWKNADGWDKETADT